MDIIYNIYGKTLKTQTFELDFDNNIEKVILYDNVLVVLLAITDENGRIMSDIYDNIYGVNLQGKVLWRIENLMNTPPMSAPSNQEDSSKTQEVFTGMNLSTDGVFTAITFFATKYSFDYKTGRLLKKEQGRW